MCLLLSDPFCPKQPGECLRKTCKCRYYLCIVLSSSDLNFFFFKNKKQVHNKKYKKQVQAHGCLSCLFYLWTELSYEFIKCLLEQSLRICFVLNHQLCSRAAPDKGGPHKKLLVE